MYGGSEDIETSFFWVLGTLFFVDEREDEWRDARMRAYFPYGNRGVAIIDQWFDRAHERGRGKAAEVASVYAESAAKNGYLEVDRHLDAAEWAALSLDDPARLTERDWLRSEIDATLPAPSLVVDRGSVYCFAHADPGLSWVFFDFEQLSDDDPDPSLRSVRTFRVRYPGGMLLTPLGRRLFLGFGD